MSDFEKPSEPAVEPLSHVRSTPQTPQNSDDANLEPTSSIVTTREIEEWR
jgi:hypothetical protein